MSKFAVVLAVLVLAVVVVVLLPGCGALAEREDAAARRLENFLRVSLSEVKAFARLTGNADVRGMGVSDLCTTNSEISTFTSVRHV